MNFRRFTQVFRHRARRAVDVDPVQLVALNYLHTVGAAPVEDVFGEAQAWRAVPREVFDASIAGAAAQDLLAYRYQPDGDRTLLVLTEFGSRLKGKLPSTSASTLRIYL
jgi:hypothetical protein